MAISPYDQETRQRAVRLYLNCSEYLGMVVDYLSSQPNRAGYQVSTKQGSGPIATNLCLLHGETLSRTTLQLARRAILQGSSHSGETFLLFDASARLEQTPKSVFLRQPNRRFSLLRSPNKSLQLL